MEDLEAAIQLIAAEIEADLTSIDLDTWQDRQNRAEQVLAQAILKDQAELADRAWFLRKTAEMYADYLECFQMMSKADYYNAWCKLERTQIGLLTLRRNSFLSLEAFDIAGLEERIAQWQSLYPYGVFISPEIAKKAVRCSICSQLMDPWSACKHEPGHVYAGRECHAVVEDAEILGISLVTNPVQKYSVAFPTDENGQRRDNNNYSIVSYVVRAVASPFDKWTANWTQAYHPHSIFNGRSHDTGCPCGSGRKYGDCCLSRPGVVRPHLEVIFEHQPPAELPRSVLVGYDNLPPNPDTGPTLPDRAAD